MSQPVETVPLHLAASDKYLSYAMSVITSRALPDVRDGLKPVQRRILYGMYNDMGLVSTSRYSKCAAVVGEVMGKYHPHGDQSIYDALARMAQDFSMRAPLVDGQGNFGSMDGDPPAAMRYTECRLQPIAEELLSEIKKKTVDFRPNYDGQRLEPVVLPAQLPHLLVNGSEGIAVGMATRIPPHNLTEVVTACIALIENRSLTVRDLLEIIKGPDFPTGGRVLATAAELEKIYETGQGSLKVRATWSEVDEGAGRQIILDSIPYGQNKSKVVEHIGEEVRTRRLPQVVDVRDESTDKVRVVLDLQPDARAEDVMAYLFKRTDLQTTWAVNLTALVPVPGKDVPRPERLNLKQLLEYWLDFRLETVRRRYEYDLEVLRQRIHILEGLEKIFDALDEAIRIIRRSDGRKDAAANLIARFELSEIQTDAILELHLYKLAKLEIEAIRAELADKRERAEHIEKILASEQKLWNEVRKELQQIRKHHGSPRRAVMGEGVALEFDENAYIVAEDTFVVVTRDGWMKRQSSYRGLDKVRVREGDEIGWLLRADTRSTLTFFTNQGGAYVIRVDGVPQTSGYGEPVQASFTFSDGEVLVGVMSNDARHRIPARPLGTPDDPLTPYAAAVTVAGRGMRFSLPPHTEISNRTGRRFARLVDGDQVLAVLGLPNEDDRGCLVTSEGRAVVLATSELPILKGAGKGLPVVELETGESVLAFELGTDTGGAPLIESTTSTGTPRGRKQDVVHKWLRAPVILDREPVDIDLDALPALAPYRTPPRTGPTPEEKQELAEKRAAERQALAERKAAEKLAAAERAAEKRAAAEKKAVEKQEAAERLAAERQAAAERKAAEQQAAAEQKAVEQQQKAAERQAAAERKEAEKQAKAAESQAAAERRAAEKKEAAERAEAEKQERAAERQAAAERKEAEKREAAEQKAAERRAEAERKAAAEAERAAEKQAAAERRAAEKREVAEREAAERQAEAERKAAAAAERAAEKQAAADRIAAEKQQKAAEKQAAADRIAAEKQAAADKKAAEKQAAADKKEAEKQAAAERAAEKQAEAERIAAERQAAAAMKAAEKQAAADQKEAEKRAAAERAAEKQAAADKKAAEKQAAADLKEAEKRAAAERAAEKQAAAEKKEAEKQQKAAEKQAAADKKEAEKRAAAERAAEKQAAAEKKEAEKQQKAAEKKAAADQKEAEKQAAAERAAEKQAAADKKEAEKQVAAERAAEKPPAEKQGKRGRAEQQESAAEKPAAAEPAAATVPAKSGNAAKKKDKKK